MQGGLGTEHGDNVRIVFPVRRQDGGNHLGLAAEPFRKQRTDGTIN